ncbi:hypothetical protein NEOLEDRAFT_314347 [Neolentinus lepideus HHB14362 ss-1]|uniref:Uncharacterized protein n=1 Tax=Neolentinus lepideus HHB14362 ss-1 TaxID=1314782 RepID=A0A165VTL9_9AGAM|nr:hypothetical protein NEOLEDRAFT_314347 [Neolentinus lepideus HHB14362 ss-1]
MPHHSLSFTYLLQLRFKGMYFCKYSTLKYLALPLTMKLAISQTILAFSPPCSAHTALPFTGVCYGYADAINPARNSVAPRAVTLLLRLVDLRLEPFPSITYPLCPADSIFKIIFSMRVSGYMHPKKAVQVGCYTEDIGNVRTVVPAAGIPVEPKGFVEIVWTVLGVQSLQVLLLGVDDAMRPPWCGRESG